MRERPYRLEPLEAIRHILNVSREINLLKDVDAILDRILYEARHFSGADAGAIYTVENGRLKFGYVHNDKLFRKDAVDKSVYADFTMPIDDSSIVGHAAAHGEVVKIKGRRFPLPRASWPWPMCRRPVQQAQLQGAMPQEKGPRHNRRGHGLAL